MNYMLKISAGKVFRLQFSFFYIFVWRPVPLYHNFAGKFRSIIFVIDLQWKAKQGFVASHRAPTFQP